jgi:hypothetical protein
MEYFGGFGDLGVHGRQMIGAAKMALGWANDLEGKGKKSLHLSAIPARKVAV